MRVCFQRDCARMVILLVSYELLAGNVKKHIVDLCWEITPVCSVCFVRYGRGAKWVLCIRFTVFYMDVDEIKLMV